MVSNLRRHPSYVEVCIQDPILGEVPFRNIASALDGIRSDDLIGGAFQCLILISGNE